LAFQLADLGEHFERLPRLKSPAALDREQQTLAGFLERIRQADIHVLCQVDGTHSRPRLEELLAAVANILPAVSNAITHGYFSLAQMSQQLASLQSRHTS
jgi:hypothetical protein